MSLVSSQPRKKLWGIVTRRERWGLSWRGYVVIGIVLALGAAAFLFGVHTFFSITEPVEARLLAVEGWVDAYAIAAAAREFQAKSYERVFTTGGPVHGMGGYTNDYNTAASVGAGRLRAAGVPAHLVQMVPSRINHRDRTYSSALALRVWCDENKVPLTSINVLTEDVHARRTRLLFQKALGKDVRVGIIAVPNPDYDERHWWHYSEGVRAVLGECIAYVYAGFFFHPDAPHVSAQKDR
jgi:uncharacterized SAM-binding protein YcdF (DUF218 family)